MLTSLPSRFFSIVQSCFTWRSLKPEWIRKTTYSFLHKNVKQHAFSETSKNEKILRIISEIPQMDANKNWISRGKVFKNKALQIRN